MVLGATLAVACAAGPRADLAVTGALIHPDADAPAIAGVILVRNGRILSVGHASGRTVRRAVEHVDAAGLHAAPGLWDAHTHIRAGPSGLDLSKFPAHGVTAVRDLGGSGVEIRSAKTAIAAGAPGPDIYPALEQLNGAAFGPFQRAVSSEIEVAAAVDELARAGAVVIKVHRALPPRLLPAAVARAELHGLGVTGHIPIGMAPLAACEAGMEGIEHIGSFIEAYVSEAPGRSTADAVVYMLGDASRPLYDCLRRRSVFVTPTLVLYRAVAASRGASDSPSARQFIADVGRITRRLSDEGVPLLVGTDVSDAGGLPIAPGYSVVDEMEMLVAAGVPVRSVFAAATSRPARAVGLDEVEGTLRPGARANIVLLRSDPTVNTSAFREPIAVVVRGEIAVDARD